MMLENKTVCAKFPQHVRNIVTPFIVMMLALVTIKGLHVQGGMNNGRRRNFSIQTSPSISYRHN